VRSWPTTPVVTDTVCCDAPFSTVTVDREPSVCTAELGTVSTPSTFPTEIVTAAPDPSYRVAPELCTATVIGNDVAVLVEDDDFSTPMAATVPVNELFSTSGRTSACWPTWILSTADNGTVALTR